MLIGPLSAAEGVQNVLRQVDEIAASEPAIVAALQKSVADKAVIAAEFAAIDREGQALTPESNELAAYCSGEYEAPELSRRQARCAAELPILEQRRQTLVQRLDAAKAAEAQRSARAAQAKQALAQLHTRAAALDGRIAKSAVLRATPCKRGLSLLEWAKCLRKAAADACGRAERRIAADRQEIERNRREIATSRQELATWRKLNAEAQKGAVMAGLKFVAADYAAGARAASDKLERLVRKADRKAAKLVSAKKLEMRMKYARELEAEIERLRVPLRDVWGREMAGVAVDLESKWSIARDQLHIELKAAAERNGKLQRIIDSPEFKEAFSADGIDNSGADLAGTLVEEASKELFVFVAGAKTYESLTGPHVRAFVFVRDSAYNALLSYFSTERVLQQNELAGELAKAAGVLQAKYQRDVDALKECRQ